MPDQPDQDQQPTETLPKTGLRVPVPKREDVNLPVNEQLIVELYSK